MNRRVLETLGSTFSFDEEPEVVPWLEEHIRIPKEMSPRYSGPFSTFSRPIMRPLLNAWHPNSGVRSVVASFGAQTAKTTIMVLGVCYRLRFMPVPTMIVAPSQDFCQTEISEMRLHPLIESNPELRRLKPLNPDKFRKMSMMMEGGRVILKGANSSTSLAGSTQGIIAIDEAAKIEHHQRDDAPEAHPILNAKERTNDFGLFYFHWESGTPNSPLNQFWVDFENGDQTHFFVPCPHCGEYFALDFEEEKSDPSLDDAPVAELSDKELANPQGGYRSLIWSPDARGADGLWNKEKVYETVRYICKHCGGDFGDDEKPGMIAQFEEHKTNPNASEGDRSFWATSFYSPSLTMGQIAMKFLDRGDLFSSGLQAFTNSTRARPWEQWAVSIKDQEIWDCKATDENGRSLYKRGTIPVDPKAIVIAADPGQDQTYWVVCALDKYGNCWVIDWGTVLAIENLIALPLSDRCRYQVTLKEGLKLSPMLGLCDSGNWSEDVYEMCQASGGFWFPSKGTGAESGTWRESTPSKNRNVRLVSYVDTVSKDDLYDRRIHKKKGSQLYLPGDVTHDLVGGLAGQKKEDGKGWKKVKNDHFGDCIKECIVGGRVATN